MKNKYLINIITCIIFIGCSYDNYVQPESILSGKVTYKNEPVSVRSNGTQLELWQDGYALRAKIPVYIAQDGSYSAILSDGNYKIVRLSGAPWENQTDTISVTVKGNTALDIPVIPYFIVKNVTFQKTNNEITTKFVIEKISQTANLNLARLYLGKTLFTDQNNNATIVALNASSITIGQEVTIKATIPKSLESADYLFARVGVQAKGVGELYYSVPQKIHLK